jgi:hypothetical protein
MTTPGNLRSVGIVAHPLNRGCQVLNSVLFYENKFLSGLDFMGEILSKF